MKPIVVHVAAEVSPFHKSGGLGDVLAGLPPALGRAGLDVRVVTGFFGTATSFASLRHPVREWPVRLELTIAGQRIDARILEARTHGGDATTYFVDAHHLSRGGLYGHDDDAFRFAIMSKAAVAIAGVLQRSKNLGRVAVLHAHDWHASLALHYARSSGSSIQDAARVFTIHNLAYQGDASASTTPYLDLSWDDYHAFFEHRGTLNLMKGAILQADRVTTVSPTYANEIQTPIYGYGLDGLLRHVRGKLVGIVNGIDVRAWNPSNDRHLPTTYSADTVRDDGAKETCREALRWELGLENRDDAPVVGCVSRLTHQKGVDQLCDVASRFVREGGQVVVLGEGDEPLEHRLHWLEAGHRGSIAYRRAFDEGLAHRIYAGSDLYAMPSRFEPCGLAQMYAMRYGTIPVARATGGLVDTISPLINRHEVGGANGVLYADSDPEALLRALRWAREVYWDHAALEAIRNNAMRANHSWDHAAINYINMYRELGLDFPAD